MNQTIQSMAGILLSFLTLTTVSAQENWDATKNPTVDSLTAPYKIKIVEAPPALTAEDVFPVLGTYLSASISNSQTITITLDSQNKGIIWIEGLPQGKIKGFLRKSPATYKIPVQQADNGNPIQEGTLLYDKNNNTLQICIGQNYNSAEPAAIFSTTNKAEVEILKSEKTTKPVTQKTWFLIAKKQTKETAMK